VGPFANSEKVTFDPEGSFELRYAHRRAREAQ